MMNGKQKNSLLVIVFFLSLVIAYQLAFSKTIKLRENLIQNKKESLSSESIATKMAQLFAEKKYNDSILKNHSYTSKASFQTNLLQSINSISKKNNLKVIHFLEPQKYSKGDAVYTNYQVSLRGKYESILRLLFTIEEEYKYGKLLSVNFNRKKNYRTGANFLDVDFILQRVE